MCKIHVIGNPPFGRQSILAKEFIKKSVSFADTISFILPRSFKKDSMKKVFPLEWHLVYQYDLPKNSFMINETQSMDVPSVFQIWQKNESKSRISIKKYFPIGFSFVSKKDNPNFSIRRIGFYAGKVYLTTQDKSPESHYFIKVDDNSKKYKEILEIFQSLQFKHQNTVGPRSVSKQEILRKLPNTYRRTY